MAGGKIIRLVGGLNHTECETWIVYTNNFTSFAGQGSVFTADSKTTIGKPKEMPSPKKYFEKGWWTDINGVEIKEAKLDDKVQFHVKMKNIFSSDWSKEFLEMQLREFDGNSIINLITFGLTSYKVFKPINLDSANNELFKGQNISSNMEVVCNIILNKEGLSNIFSKEFKDNVSDNDIDIELYMHCGYYSQMNKEYEEDDLPRMESDYLVVKPPDLMEPIIFVESSVNHKLPILLSSEDGSPWFIAAINNPESLVEKIATLKGAKEIHDDLSQPKKISEDIELIKNYFKENGGGQYKPEEINKWSKRAYNIAIRKLKKGKLTFNNGSTGTTARLYNYTISDIDNRFNEEITMGVNRGKFETGITSKGINQLEAQSSRGIAKIFKTVGEVAPILSTLCDLADIITSAANGERPPLPFTPPFVTWEITKMFDEMYEEIRQQWLNDLQKTFFKGKEAVKEYLKMQPYTGDPKVSDNIGYALYELSPACLQKIIMKEISGVNLKTPNTLEQLLLSESKGNTECGIVAQSIYGKDDYGRQIKKHFIHAIFFSNSSLAI